MDSKVLHLSPSATSDQPPPCPSQISLFQSSHMLLTFKARYFLPCVHHGQNLSPMAALNFCIFLFLMLGHSSTVVGSAFDSINLRGVSPQEFSYYQSGPVISCKDGLGSFSVDRLNDDFCDCVDGTDEPGTSACPNGRFYCKNQRNSPLWIFSSRVDDGICDCCDGSDEHDRNIKCPTTCLVGGVDDNNGRTATILQRDKLNFFPWKSGGKQFNNAVHIFRELKALMMLEMSLVFVFLYQVYKWASRRGSHLRKKLPR